MRKKKAFAALALVILYHLAAVLPIAELRPSEVRALGNESISWAATSPQTPESRFEIRETGGTLLENVAAVLQRKYYDKSFATGVLPGLVSRYTEKAKSATTLREQRMVIPARAAVLLLAG